MLQHGCKTSSCLEAAAKCTHGLFVGLILQWPVFRQTIAAPCLPPEASSRARRGDGEKKKDGEEKDRAAHLAQGHTQYFSLPPLWPYTHLPPAPIVRVSCLTLPRPCC